MANNDAAAAKPKTVTVELRDLGLRGQTVHTRWGNVKFDENGMSKLTVPEVDVPLLQAMNPFSWLASDHLSYQMGLEKAKQKPDSKSEK